MTSGTVPVVYTYGTSMSAPLVAGVAGLLLSMDPTLTPGQVKDYILRGAQVPRNDSLTAVAAAPSPVSGIPGVYQLDAYGALMLVSKERAGTPVCGYSVSRGGDVGTYLRLEKNGPLAPPTDSIKVPGAGWHLGYIGVAPGGRLFSAYTGIDSLNGGWGSIIYFNYQGQRLGAGLDHYGGRHHVERHIVDHRQMNNITSAWQQLTLRRSDGAPISTMNLTLPDGTLVALVDPWSIDISPDARFAAFSISSGTYVQRFADNTTTLVSPGTRAASPRWNQAGTRLIVFASDTSYNHTIRAYHVDSTAHGGFTLLQTATGAGRRLDNTTSRFSGDDAIFFTGESSRNPLQYFVAARAGASLGTKGPEVERYWGNGQIGNIAIHR